MPEVWGSTAAVRYQHGRVVVSPLSADDDTALDAALTDLHTVMLGMSDDGDSAVLLFHLRSRDFLVNGVPNLRCPVSVHIGGEAVAAAKEFVSTINDHLVELRRMRWPDQPPAPPTAMSTPLGPRRPDVDAAAGRMRHTDRKSARLMDAVHTYCRDENGYVLEIARARYRSTPGLVVITTTRLLFVSGGFAHECPLEVITDAQVVRLWQGGPWTLQVADGDLGLSFEDRRPEDVHRVAAAVNYARDLQRTADAIAPQSPSSADLFAEWQTLLEHRQLGTITDEEFQRQAFGTLLAVSGH